MRKLMKWFMLASLSVVLAACGSADDPALDDPGDEGEGNLIQENAVVDVAADAGLSAFAQALDDAFGEDEFRREGESYTFFAPTDAALAAADLDAGEDVLEYHVVEGTYTLDDLESGSLETISGLPLEVSREGGSVSLNGEAEVVEPNNLEAVNGVVHAIDSVLTPPEGTDGPDEPEEPEDNTFTADLSVLADEVESEATGVAAATLEGDTLSVAGSAQDLSSDITQVGLYEGGGDDVGVLFYELEVSGTDFSGTFSLSQEERAILRDENFYVTVSTETYPEGEISGPLVSE